MLVEKPVAALRSAEAGLRTCVLERGKEYASGEFLQGMADAPAHFRIDGSGDAVGGYEDALFDLRIGEKTIVLVGCEMYAGGGRKVIARCPR